MFQHRMVVSTPPEKQRSPFGETVRARTGPVCALKIGLKNTTLSLHSFNKYSNHLKSGHVQVLKALKVCPDFISDLKSSSQTI